MTGFIYLLIAGTLLTTTVISCRKEEGRITFKQLPTVQSINVEGEMGPEVDPWPWDAVRAHIINEALDRMEARRKAE